MSQADTPPVISPYAEPLQDQDEKGSLAPHVARCALNGPAGRQCRQGLGKSAGLA